MVLERFKILEDILIRGGWGAHYLFPRLPWGSFYLKDKMVMVVYIWTIEMVLDLVVDVVQLVVTRVQTRPQIRSRFLMSFWSISVARCHVSSLSVTLFITFTMFSTFGLAREIQPPDTCFPGSSTLGAVLYCTWCTVRSSLRRQATGESYLSGF